MNKQIGMQNKFVKCHTVVDLHRRRRRPSLSHHHSWSGAACPASASSSPSSPSRRRSHTRRRRDPWMGPWISVALRHKSTTINDWRQYYSQQILYSWCGSPIAHQVGSDQRRGAGGSSFPHRRQRKAQGRAAPAGCHRPVNNQGAIEHLGGAN
jgi:hypothetical protein